MNRPVVQATGTHDPCLAGQRPGILPLQEHDPPRAKQPRQSSQGLPLQRPARQERERVAQAQHRVERAVHERGVQEVAADHRRADRSGERTERGVEAHRVHAHRPQEAQVKPCAAPRVHHPAPAETPRQRLPERPLALRPCVAAAAPRLRRPTSRPDYLSPWDLTGVAGLGPASAPAMPPTWVYTGESISRNRRAYSSSETTPRQ